MTNALKDNRVKMGEVWRNGDVVQPFRRAAKISLAAVGNYVRNPIPSSGGLSKPGVLIPLTV